MRYYPEVHLKLALCPGANSVILSVTFVAADNNNASQSRFPRLFRKQQPGIFPFTRKTTEYLKYRKHKLKYKVF